MQGSSSTSEFWVLGPPGTGKTTRASHYIRKAAEKHGSNRLLVASFTRAAAAELVGRDLPIERDRVGTLHSHCFRALGHPDIAEAHISEWNESHADYSIGGGNRKADLDDPSGGSDGDEAAAGGGKADDLFKRAQLLRARMVPREHWPQSVAAFDKEWSAWKDECGFLDFTDLIERGITDIDGAPGGAEIGFFDEAQDFTALELALARKWCGRMERYMFIGDDDQTIYAFKGADPRVFIGDDLPDTHVEVLKQSYRIPASVHRVAQRITDALSFRKAKVYHPREEEGRVALSSATWKAPARLLEVIERRIADGQTVMILAQCKFLLKNITTVLRESAVPFWNPYKRNHGGWNPLQFGGDKKQTAIDRIFAFLAIDPEVNPSASAGWTWGHVQSWTKHVAAKDVLVAGAKVELAKKDPNAYADVWTLAEFFDAAALERALSCDLEWFRSVLLGTKTSGYEFPLDIIAKRGKNAVRENPKVCIGTIHSVKGGEADTVILFPDVSLAAAKEWGTTDGRDSLHRLFYVGATRARHELIVCSPGHKWSFPLGRYL